MRGWQKPKTSKQPKRPTLAPVPPLAIIDTSVYVNLLRYRHFEEELVELPHLVRMSTVVISELLRGARSRKALEAVEALYHRRALVTPTTEDWLEAGRILAILSQRKHYERQKLQELHFDVLIALTARRIGAWLITINREDFQAIREIKDFKLIIWPTTPKAAD